MAKIKACYIKDGQVYVEKKLSELHIEGTKVLEYPDRRFYYFSGYLMEVTPETQKELLKEKNRAKYVKKRNSGTETLSLDVMIADDVQGYDLLIDPTDYAGICIDMIMGETAMRLVRELPPDEHDMIVSICVNGMSEYAYAREKGIPRMTVHDRKARILHRLRKEMEKTQK